MSTEQSDQKMLYTALLLLKTEEECADFLRDLLTDEEIEDFVSRWKIARMLDEKVSYEEIQNITKRSSTTVARVSKWLKKSKNGYKLILMRMKDESNTG